MAVSVAPINKMDLIKLHSKCRGDASDLSLTDFLNLVDNYQKQGPAFQYVLNGHIIGVAGILTINQGVGHIWSILSDEVEKAPKSFIKRNKEIVALCVDYHRLQCDVRADKPNWVKMIKLWGFQEEGVLRKMNKDKTDSVMLSRVVG